MTTMMILLNLLLCFMLIPRSSYGDKFTDVDENSQGLTEEQKRMIKEAKITYNNLEVQERYTKTEVQKDKLRQLRYSYKQSFTKVTIEMKNEPASAAASSGESKVNYAKIADGLGKLNDVLWKLNSTDENVLMQGLCEVVGVFAQVIPPPVGTLLSTVAMIGAVVAGSSLPTAGETTSSIVRSELALQYLKELTDKVKGEALLIDNAIVHLRVASDREFKESQDCQERLFGKLPDGTQMTDQQKQHCDQSAVSDDNRLLILLEMSKGSVAGISVIGMVQNALSRESETVSSMEQLQTIRELLSMCAKLSSLRFVMFTELKLYVETYMPNATQYLEAEVKKLEIDEENFGKWIDSTLGGTKVHQQSILALYLLRNPVPGMELLTEKIAGTMKGLIQQGGNRKIKMEAECPLHHHRVETFEELGFYVYNSEYTYVLQCTVHKYIVNYGTYAADYCKPKSRGLHFDQYSSTDLSQGLVISQDSNRSATWGIDYQNYLFLRNRNEKLSAFAFHPVGIKGKSKWFMMVTMKDGKRPDYFSFVYITNPKYLYAENKDFNWFSNTDRMFFKFK